MKKTLLTLIAATIAALLHAQNFRTIAKPAFGYRNSSRFEVEKVELTPEATILHLQMMYASTEPPFSIGPAAYIRAGADGEKLAVAAVEGILLEQEIYVEPRSFSLSFPAIDPKTPKIDFIAGDAPYDQKIFDIELIPSRPAKSALAAACKNVRPLTGACDLPVIDTAAAVYSGKIEGYAPRYELRSSITYCTLTDKIGRKEIGLPIRDDGTFSIRIPVQYPSEAEILLWIENRFGQDDFYPVHLEPGRETVQSIDLRRLANNRSAYPELHDTIGEAFVNYGELARVNDDLRRVLRKIGKPFLQDDRSAWGERIYGLSPEEFKKVVLEISQARQDSIRAIRDLCPRALDIALRTEQAQTICDLNSYQMYAMNADIIKNKLFQTRPGRFPNMNDYEKPSDGYYDFMEDYAVNDERMLVSQAGIDACGWYRTRPLMKLFESRKPDSLTDFIALETECLASVRANRMQGVDKGLFFDLWRLQIGKSAHHMNRPQPFGRADFSSPMIYSILQQYIAVPPDNR